MPPRKPSPLQVLVVEDNAVNQRLVVAFLEEAGHTPVLAASGREALAALESRSFDLVLMDIQMPDMDGFQVTAAIRARDESTGSRHTIVALTAHATREDRERCLAAGMDGYLAKPVRYEELIQLVEGSVVRAGEPATAPPQAGLGRPGLRKELTPLFVDDAAHLHAEMRDAIARRDGAALQRAAHNLRGTAGFFKAQAVCDLARRLEDLGRAEDFSDQTDRVSQELGEELARLTGMAE
jgi:two-component system, sensor histidine kinase and response regulator